jgi:tetratricopeptide (TPR) repeat protein
MDQVYPLGFTCAKLGFAYLNKGEFAQALSVLERAAQVARRSQTYNVLMAVGAHIGHAYKMTGRIQKAVAALEETRDLAHGKNLAWLSRIVAHLADAYSLAGRTDEALQSGRLAVDLAHTHGMLGYEVWALYLLGEIYARIHGQRDAVQLLSQALPLAEGRGMRPVAAHCHLGLGKLYRRTGQREEAHEHLTTATAMYREMDMGFWLEKAEAETIELA